MPVLGRKWPGLPRRLFTHHGRGSWEGRCASLLPVTWTNGWPIVGDIGPDGLGSMVWSGKMPAQGTPMVVPQTSDEFDAPRLPPQWEWNYQPRADKWSLTERPGWLRLHAFRPIGSNNLMKAGNRIWLKSAWGLAGKSQYSYSLDGRTFTQFGRPFPLSWGNYRGDRMGIYNYNSNAEQGCVDVEFFHYAFSRPLPRNSILSPSPE